MSRNATEGRWPDFVILGAMKAATTTVFRWLEEHPATCLPQVKEPDFFSRADRFARGPGWYRSLFPSGPGCVTGEASVSYSDPLLAETTAQRISEFLPQARLVFIHRDPADRARSHYLHEVRRARERRPFLEALTPDSPYVLRRCSARGLGPFLAGPLARNLLIVDFAELTGPDEIAWHRLLDHVGLTRRDRPASRANVGEQSPHYGALFAFLKARGIVHHLDRLPAPVRRLGRPLLVRSGDDTRELRESVSAAIPAEIQRLWDDDLAALERLR